jgi:hypothetical protein
MDFGFRRSFALTGVHSFARYLHFGGRFAMIQICVRGKSLGRQ